MEFVIGDRVYTPHGDALFYDQSSDADEVRVICIPHNPSFDSNGFPDPFEKWAAEDVHLDRRDRRRQG
jgi:hypothetical protein